MLNHLDDLLTSDHCITESFKEKENNEEEYSEEEENKRNQKPTEEEKHFQKIISYLTEPPIDPPIIDIHSFDDVFEIIEKKIEKDKRYDTISGCSNRKNQTMTDFKSKELTTNIPKKYETENENKDNLLDSEFAKNFLRGAPRLLLDNLMKNTDALKKDELRKKTLTEIISTEYKNNRTVPEYSLIPREKKREFNTQRLRENSNDIEDMHSHFSIEYHGKPKPNDY